LQIGDLPIGGDKNLIYVRTGKGKTKRTVEIGSKFTKKLRQFVRKYRKSTGVSDYLFISERNTEYKAYCYFSVYSKVKRIGRDAGIKTLTPHVLRHTYLTRLYNVERDLRFVQDQAGHCSPITTAIYAKTDQKNRRRQVEALEKQQNPSKDDHDDL